jgi:aryl-alcohol dehydrogenase-like predicted oxidoreductase
VYSDGLSEKILGKAIKEIGMNRDEIVVMTKVFFWSRREVAPIARPTAEEKDRAGYVNQYGLSRKVGVPVCIPNG